MDLAEDRSVQSRKGYDQLASRRRFEGGICIGCDIRSRQSETEEEAGECLREAIPTFQLFAELHGSLYLQLPGYPLLRTNSYRC